MATKFIFTKNGEPDSERVVSIQVPIGTVCRTWFRLHGDCWTNSRACGYGFATRQEAAADLLKRHNAFS